MLRTERGRVIAHACFEVRLARVGSWACGGTVGGAES